MAPSFKNRLKTLQISVCFLNAFSVRFGTPKRSKNRAQEASKTALEPVPAPRGSRDRFWTVFGTPWNLKTHDFTREGRQKSRFSCLASGQQNRPPNDPKMSPKSTPKRLPEGHNGAQKRCWISGSILALILSFLGVPKVNNRMVKKCPKSITQGLQGSPPEASRVPFWPHFRHPGVHFRACARPTTRSKTLFEITSQRIFCDRCGTDAQNTEGSVAGLGPQAHWRSGH